MSSKYFLWVGIPLLNTLFQIFTKLAAEEVKGAESIYEWIVRMAAAPWIYVAVAVEIICFILWIRVLAEIDLSKAFPLSALSYILIIVSSAFIFHEKVSNFQLLGGGLILAGICLIGTASTDAPGKSNHHDAIR